MRLRRWGLFVIVAVLVVGFTVYRLLSPTFTPPSQLASIAPYTFDFLPPIHPTDTLVIVLHGGSWIVGDKVEMVGVARYLAAHGASVINLNYRLAPQSSYDAPLQDIAAVIKTVDADQAAYHLTDHYKLVLLGFSAGGHLAAQFCLTEAHYQVKQASACIGLAGVYDLDRIMNNQDGPVLKEAVKLFLELADPKAASPVYQVKPGESTKFFLARGNLDVVVPAVQLETFRAALQANQVPVETMLVPGKEHLTLFSTVPLGDALGQKILSFIR